jgi:adenosylcobyric acid synthase
METVLTADKVTSPAKGFHCASGEAITGYEIHLGVTSGPDCARPMVMVDGRPDGAVALGGRIAGCYVHGLFGADGFRKAYLAGFGITSSLAYEERVDQVLDGLADHLEAHLDLDRILGIARAGLS